MNSPAGEEAARALARALVREPDLLVLDEPTDHSDITSIQWLERFLRAGRARCSS